MKRLEEFQTPEGQAAWNYYQEWMKVQRRMPPPAKSFLASKYYRTFINFTQHVKAVGLPFPAKFIWLMREKDIQPTIWTNDEVYSMYIEHLDRTSQPLDQAKLSVQTLLDLADKRNVDVSEIFDHIPLNDVVQLVRRRQLSPWLLLCSRKFKQVLRDRATPEQKIIVETIIRPDYWVEQLEKHPNELAVIKQYVAELSV